MILREEYFRRLVDNAHVELYLSANDGARVYWPWRMQPPVEASMNYRNACEEYIIDSDPLDESVTTEHVLDRAHELNAEMASLADEYHDKDGTVDAILKGLETFDSHPFDGGLLIPLQAPYVECWKEIGELTQYSLGIGGLKDAHDSDRIKAAESLRNAVGPDVNIHGFGWGVNGMLGNAIRGNPKLLDSVDYSTPVQSADYTDSLPGDERMSVTAAHSAARLIKDLRSVSGHVTEPSNKTLQDFT